MTYCNGCKLEKSVLEFSRDNSRKSGYQNWCKLCYRKWRESNSEHLQTYMKNYERIPSNIERSRKRHREYYQNNRQRKISEILRQRIRDTLNRKSKTKRTIELLGCSIEEFEMYLESQFQPGMTWDNWTRRWVAYRSYYTPLFI